MKDNTQISISLIRESQNSGEQPLVDVINVPASLQGGCQEATLQNVMALMQRISTDFAQTELGRLTTRGGTEPMLPADFLSIPAEFLHRYNVSVQPVDTSMSMTIDMDEELAEPTGGCPDTQQYRRICVQRSGYATVPGNTDEEALAYAAENLDASDFDWESVTADLIRDGEVVEACGPNGEQLPSGNS